MGFKKIIVALTTALLVFMVASCVDGSCFDDTEAFVGATFYSGTVQKSPTKLTLTGSGMAEKIYDNQASVKLALIPLDPEVDECSFDMAIDGTVDVITVKYKVAPMMVSRECGYSFIYDLISVTSTNNIIDSIRITNVSASIPNEENIRIYY